MKVDIEGFELAALRSLGEYLANGLVRTFLIEVHPQQLAVLGSHSDELVALLARHGYRQIGTGDPQVWTLQGQ